MSAVASPVALHRPLAPEEAARADFYALLGRLFIAPPDGALLTRLVHFMAGHGMPGNGNTNGDGMVDTTPGAATTH